MNRIEKETDQTLKMGECVQRVNPSEKLMARLREIPENIKEAYDRVPKKVVWTVAASVAVLIVMNFVSLRQYSNSDLNSLNQAQEESHFSYLKQL